jgi:hypothetical protein
MDGTTAQIAGLIITGNHYLRGGDLKGWWPDSPVFKFCKFVHFITLSGEDNSVEHPYTDDPLSWFAKQKDEGVIGFRLVHIPVNKPMISDRQSAGFVGGGGRKIIEAVHDKTMDGWESGWRVGDQNDPDRNIWHVNYARIGQGIERRDIIPLHPVGLMRLLNDTLVDTAVFARKHEYAAGWVEMFDAAMMALKSDAALATSFHFKDYEAMIPDVRARRLLAAASAGWVFGAMGSWNDMSFEGEVQKEYEAVSDKLFGLMIDAIVTAVNSTFDPAEEG